MQRILIVMELLLDLDVDDLRLRTPEARPPEGPE